MSKKKNSTIKKKNTTPTIYIQIAAYRDPELIPTIQDCLTKAAHPENLRFGIGWQYSPYDEWDTIDEFKDDPRFRILAVDYRQARGPCWIRHQLNQLYENETYILQIDSHHRFIENWDTTLIEMLESLRSKKCKKPLLSSYLPSYNPDTWPEHRVEDPWLMEFDRIAPEGPVHFLPHTIDNWKELNSPVPSRFISGHFIFADGSFVLEVPYDPEYYFHGEEINLSVRAYMAGYDLFAPHRAFMWHEYTRNGKKKHWDDHKNWNELDKQSYKHNRELLGIDEMSSKQLTRHQRTLRDYELYAGIEFHTRKVHKLTLEKKLPPVSLDEKSHIDGLITYHRMCIDIYRPTFAEEDYTFWAVAFHDKEGNEIYRQDVDKEEAKRLLAVPLEQDKFIHIWRNFYSEKLPHSWVVWPQSESKGFMDRLTGEFTK